MLLFYPFAFTGVCTGELCELRDHLPQFSDRGHPAARRLPHSDRHPAGLRRAGGPGVPAAPSDFWPHGEVSRAYGVFAEDKGCAVRGTFVIDKEGVVRWTVVNALPDARDLNEYVEALDTL